MLPTAPIPVKQALLKLGRDIDIVRRKRRISMALLSERCGISRGTLTKVTHGDPSVSMLAYATVLFSLNLHSNLANVADIANDPNGMQSFGEELPKRVREKSS